MPYLRFLALATCTLALSLALAPPARAEPTVCTIFPATMGTMPYEHRCAPPTSCDSDATCDPAVLGEGAVCQAYDGRSGERLCRGACSTVFGCSEGGDCPRLGGVTGRCAPTGALGGAPPGICLYDTADTSRIVYCTGTGPIAHDAFARCHTTPAGEITTNYYEGDCDEDGCPNGADPAPCLAGDEPCLEPGTLGPLCARPTVPPDAGVSLPDAGPPAADAAISTPDGGNAGEDAGGGEDAGSGGDLDAGPSREMDAGEVPPGIGFNGGGGCRCAVPGGASSSGSGALALAALALVAIARRAVRRRTP